MSSIPAVVWVNFILDSKLEFVTVDKDISPLTLLSDVNNTAVRR